MRVVLFPNKKLKLKNVENILPVLALIVNQNYTEVTRDQKRQLFSFCHYNFIKSNICSPETLS